MITIPAMLLAGIPPLHTLGTNKLQSLFGAGSATIAYARAGHVQLREQLPMAALSALGGALGAFLSTRIPERLRTALPLTFGLASIGMSITMVVKLKYLPAVILALILGAIIGELIYLEKGIGKIGGKVRKLIDRGVPAGDVRGLQRQRPRLHGRLRGVCRDRPGCRCGAASRPRRRCGGTVNLRPGGLAGAQRPG